VGDIAQDPGVELDVLEGLAGARQRELTLGGTVRVVESGPGRAPLGDPSQVLDRQRGVEPPLAAVALDALKRTSSRTCRTLGT